MEDKRTTERQEISDILYISSENGIFKGNLMNISSSGMRFSLAQKLNKKEVIDININYDPVNFIQKAFIIWSKKNEEKDKYEYGAEFINMNPNIWNSFKSWSIIFILPSNIIRYYMNKRRFRNPKYWIRCIFIYFKFRITF